MNKFKRLFEVMNFNPKHCRYAFKEEIPYKVDFLCNEKIYMDFYYESEYKAESCLFISFYSYTYSSTGCNSVKVIFSSGIPFSVGVSNKFKGEHEDILTYYFNSNEVYFEGKSIGNDESDTNFNISMLIDNENYINYTQMKECLTEMYGIMVDV